MRQLFCTALFVICAMSQSVMGQQSEPVNVPTPNAASLGRYGDIPVSYYTGNPCISVPIHTADVRGVQMPITLDYDASGVQMNALPGWTGHNWTLNAGGVITRKINGNPDEYRLTAEEKDKYRAKAWRNYDCYFKCYSVLPIYLRENIANLDNDLLYLTRDFEPDVFYFNFMGKTGRFFLGNDGQWKVYSEYNIDVLYNVADTINGLMLPFIEDFPSSDAKDKQPKTIAGFKLRDDDGNVYVFGYETDAIEYKTNMFSQSELEKIESWKATSWYLTDVYDRYGNKLYELSYRRGYFLPQFYRVEYAEIRSGHTNWGWHDVSGQNASYNSLEFPFCGELDAPVYLENIKCANGQEIHFSVGPSDINMREVYWDLTGPQGSGGYLYGYFSEGRTIRMFYYLEADNSLVSGCQYRQSNIPIQPGDFMDLLHRTRHMRLISMTISPAADIYESTAANEISYHFNYDYTSRMHLVSVSRSHWGQTGQYVHDATYSFRYKDYDKLPSGYLTKASDSWGYYNGKTYNLGNGTNFANFHQEKACDTILVKYGALSEIEYPTGGVSKFDYEVNRYSKCVTPDRQSLASSEGFGGGLRIRRITEYEDTTCSTILKSREFDYNVPGTQTSSGQLFAQPVHYWPNWRAHAMDGSSNIELSTFRNTSILPLSNSFGPSVGYTWVTERFNDGSYNVYRYTNFSEASDSLITIERFNGVSTTASPFDRFCERGYKRGKPAQIQSYDRNGQKVRSMGYIYRTDDTESSFVLGTNMRSQGMGITEALDYYTGRLYRLYYPRYDVKRYADTLFFEDGKKKITITDYSRYERDVYFDQPYVHKARVRLLAQEMTHNGNQSLSTRYTYHTGFNQSDASQDIADFIAGPIGRKSYRNGLFLKNEETRFRTQAVNSKNVSVPDCQIVYYDAGGLQGDTTVTYDAYTSTGALSSYTERGQNTTWLLWRYNDTRLAGKVSGHNGNAYNISKTGVFKADSVVTAAKAFFSSQPYPMMFATFYSYHPVFGVTSVTSSDGTTLYYEYDIMGHLSGIYDDKRRALKTFQYNYRNK